MCKAGGAEEQEALPAPRGCAAGFCRWLPARSRTAKGRRGAEDPARRLGSRAGGRAQARPLDPASGLPRGLQSCDAQTPARGTEGPQRAQSFCQSPFGTGRPSAGRFWDGEPSPAVGCPPVWAEDVQLGGEVSEPPQCGTGSLPASWGPRNEVPGWQSSGRSLWLHGWGGGAGGGESLGAAGCWWSPRALPRRRLRDGPRIR